MFQKLRACSFHVVILQRMIFQMYQDLFRSCMFDDRWRRLRRLHGLLKLSRPLWRLYTRQREPLLITTNHQWIWYDRFRSLFQAINWPIIFKFQTNKTVFYIVHMPREPGLYCHKCNKFLFHSLFSTRPVQRFKNNETPWRFI